ncbi:hypothetical protein AB0878_46345 [Amycolatopsis sp. NPDC047767]|uniref:hypothetical protein n=1 Tax=Amycolatopsis sp. NPDC047767 TaxID=3156765 RepID=UPI003452F58F
MLISFVSLEGSPGVSAAVLALTWVWPRHAVAAECDPCGGSALAVFDPDGAHGRCGALELTLAARDVPLHRAMSAQLLTLPDGTGRHHLLPGARTPQESAGIPWRRLAGLFRELDTVDVLADCGRLRTRGIPRSVMEASELVVLVVHNDRHSLGHAISSLPLIRDEAQAPDSLVAIIAPRGPAHRGFGLREITVEFGRRGIPVAGALAWDPVGAAQLTAEHRPGKRFETSPLLDTARRTAREVVRLATLRAERLQPTSVVQIDSRPPRARFQHDAVRNVQPMPVPRPTTAEVGDDA